MRTIKFPAMVFLLSVICWLVVATSTAAAQSGSVPEGVGTPSGRTTRTTAEFPPPPVEQTGPVRVSGGVTVGLLKTKVVPVYPREALRKGVTGAVVMHAVIGKDGKIQQLEAISGSDLLKQSALDAVRKWKYRPYLLNGEPTEIDTMITVNFDLNHQRR